MPLEYGLLFAVINIPVSVLVMFLILRFYEATDKQNAKDKNNKMY